jgi:hypothetical protein
LLACYYPEPQAEVGCKDMHEEYFAAKVRNEGTLECTIRNRISSATKANCAPEYTMSVRVCCGCLQNDSEISLSRNQVTEPSPKRNVPKSKMTGF